MKLKKLAICAVALCVTVPAFGYCTYVENHEHSEKAKEKLIGQIRECLKPEKNQGEDLEKKQGKCLDNLFKGVPACKSLSVVKSNKIPTWCWHDNDYNENGGAKLVHEVRVEDATKPGYFRSTNEEIATVYVAEAFAKIANSYFALKGNPKYLDYNKMGQWYERNKNTWAAEHLMKDWVLRGKGSETSYALNAFRVNTLIPSASAEERKGWIAEALKDTAWEVSLRDGIHQWWSQAVNVYHDTDTFYKVKWEIFSNIFFYDTTGAKPLRFNFRRFWDNFAIAPIYKAPKVRAQQAKKIRDVVHKDYKWSLELKESELYYPADLFGAAVKYGYWYSPEEVEAQKREEVKRKVGFYLSPHVRR